MATATELIEDLRSFGPEVRRVDYRGIGKFSATEIERHFGTFTAFKEAAFPKEVYDTSEPETNEFNGNTWNVTLPKTRIHTLPELLEYCQVDLGIWQVERFIVNRWEMGAKNAAGHVEVTPLYQIKATLIKKQNIVDARVEIEALKQEAKQSAPTPKTLIRSSREGGNLLELVIPDLHAGKLSWGKETGYGDYDTKLAEQVYERAIETLLDRSKSFVIDHIVLAVGNDLLNSDNLNSMTTKGTLVNTDTRYQKTYKTVRKMIVRTIERLRQVAPVSVKMIPGNHDTLSTFTLGDSLECWFDKFTDVTIDNAAIQHKFFTWGDCLVMLTHGDKGRKADYGLWLATECSKEFGNSKFREIHIGHTHKLQVEEKYGVRVRTLSALTQPDAWHAENLFVGNQQAAEAFVWNKKDGLVAQFFHTER
jgi:acetone carboxylase gamma subunit